MSVTEVIHRVTQTTSRSNTARFLLPNDGDHEEIGGLVMRLDSKMKDIPRPISSPVATVKTPVTAQFCGQAHLVAGLALWASSFIQTAHITFAKSTSRISDAVQLNAVRLLPLMVYMSLLVLALQAGGIVLLFATSQCPMGLWFLLVCIANLGGIYWYTALPSVPIVTIKLTPLGNASS